METAAVSFYALVSAECSETVEIYATEAEARTALGEAVADEPSWRELLSVLRLELINGADFFSLNYSDSASPAKTQLLAVLGSRGGPDAVLDVL